MAEDTDAPVSTPTPDPTAAAPAAAPPSAPMTPAPAAAVAPDPNAAQAQAQSHVDAATQAYQKAQELSKPTPPPAPVPHAKLLAMIQGLSLGLSSAATSIATHGQEGGAKEVIQVQGEQQRQKLEAQRAAQEQKNQQIQNQIMVGDTNMKMAHMPLLLATMPDEINKSHLEAANLQTTTAQNKFDLFANTGMTPKDIDQLTSGGAVDAKTSGILRANAEQQFRLSSGLLPADNPSLVAMKTALADPNTPVSNLVLAGKRLQGEVGGQEKITDAQIKKQQADAGAPFGAKADALNSALLSRYQVLNPTAKTLPAGMSLDAKSDKNDFDRIDKVMQQTENSQATKANRDIVNGMRQEMMNLAKGIEIPGDATKSGEEYVATLPPGLRDTVKAIHEGREAPPPAGSRAAAAQAVLGALNHGYPDYDATKYPSYADLRKKFTSGPEAKGINSINTVATHMGRMYDHVSAMGTLPGVSNVARAFGSKEAAALNEDRQAVSTELAKAYANGQITEGEVKEWNAKLSVWSPIELKNNIKELVPLISGKLDAYKNQWDNGSPSKGIVSPIQIVSPSAQQAFDKITGNAATQTDAHVIQIGNDQYQYNGSGDTADLKNYTKK